MLNHADLHAHRKGNEKLLNQKSVFLELDIHAHFYAWNSQ